MCFFINGVHRIENRKQIGDTLMKQKVKTKTNQKTLFEWDRQQRQLTLKVKKNEYLLELAADNTFVCFAEKEKPLPSPPSATC